MSIREAATTAIAEESEMDDPLSRALSEAPQRPAARRGRDITEHPTRELHALEAVLRGLQDQLVEAMALPFFDAGLRGDTTPVVKHGTSEQGTTRVLAQKRDPAYEAAISIEVHCDHDPRDDAASDPGRYQVRAKARVTCRDARGVTERETAFAVHEVAGTLCLDAGDLRRRVAEAIHAIGKAS